MTKVDLVDVGGGNIGSVKRCLELMNIDFVSADIDNPPKGDRPVLLPGVGAFGPVMEHLVKTGFDKRVKDLVNGGTPYLGICVGMQILFDSSEEANGVAGLGIIPGTVRKFTEGKVPQIGWNLINLVQGKSSSAENASSTSAQVSTVVDQASPVVEQASSVVGSSHARPLKTSTESRSTSTEHTHTFPESGYVYFVNSYYPAPSNESDFLFDCNYYLRFCAAVQRDNITAFQFHPEKSGTFGKTLLKRWVESVA